MATRIDFLRARGHALPLDVILSAIPGLPRAELGRLVDRAIDRLDQLDPDPDIELNGDELDEAQGEDSFVSSGAFGAKFYGPGCPISDSDFDCEELH